MLENGDLYLTFELGDEMYGLNAEQVQEITSVMNTTRVPNTPSFVLGVVNLRGKVIPTIDLRLRLGLPSRARDQRTSTIVTNTNDGEISSLIGIEVDAVSEVIRIPTECIEDSPSFGSGSALEFVQSLAKIEDSVILLLDVEAILGQGSLLDLCRHENTLR